MDIDEVVGGETPAGTIEPPGDGDASAGVTAGGGAKGDEEQFFLRVNERTAYKTAEAAAAGIAEKDAFIERLIRENREMRGSGQPGGGPGPQPAPKPQEPDFSGDLEDLTREYEDMGFHPDVAKRQAQKDIRLKLDTYKTFVSQQQAAQKAQEQAELAMLGQQDPLNSLEDPVFSAVYYGNGALAPRQVAEIAKSARVDYARQVLESAGFKVVGTRDGAPAPMDQPGRDTLGRFARSQANLGGTPRAGGGAASGRLPDETTNPDIAEGLRVFKSAYPDASEKDLDDARATLRRSLRL